MNLINMRLSISLKALSPLIVTFFGLTSHAISIGPGGSGSFAANEKASRHFSEERIYTYQILSNEECNVASSNGINCTQVAEFSPDGFLGLTFTDIENGGRYWIQGNTLTVELSSTGEVTGSLNFEISEDQRQLTLTHHSSVDGNGWIVIGSDWKRVK